MFQSCFPALQLACDVIASVRAMEVIIARFLCMVSPEFKDHQVPSEINGFYPPIPLTVYQ